MESPAFLASVIVWGEGESCPQGRKEMGTVIRHAAMRIQSDAHIVS